MHLDLYKASTDSCLLPVYNEGIKHSDKAATVLVFNPTSTSMQAYTTAIMLEQLVSTLQLQFSQPHIFITIKTSKIMSNTTPLHYVHDAL